MSPPPPGLLLPVGASRRSDFSRELPERRSQPGSRLKSLLRRAFLCLTITAVLTACGFHLQGSHSWPEPWQSYQLGYPARDLAMARFVDQLDQALRRRGLRPASDGAVRIELRRLQDRKTVAAIGGDGKAVEFDLLRELEFQLLADDWRSEVFAISSNRRLSFDPTVVLAKEAEEERLRQALSRELIELLVLRAEAELRARPTDQL